MPASELPPQGAFVSIFVGRIRRLCAWVQEAPQWSEPGNFPRPPGSECVRWHDGIRQRPLSRNHRVPPARTTPATRRPHASGGAQRPTSLSSARAPSTTRPPSLAGRWSLAVLRREAAIRPAVSHRVPAPATSVRPARGQQGRCWRRYKVAEATVGAGRAGEMIRLHPRCLRAIRAAEVRRSVVSGLRAGTEVRRG